MRGIFVGLVSPRALVQALEVTKTYSLITVPWEHGQPSLEKELKYD